MQVGRIQSFSGFRLSSETCFVAMRGSFPWMDMHRHGGDRPRSSRGGGSSSTPPSLRQRLRKRNALPLDTRLPLGDVGVEGVLLPFSLFAALPGPGRHLARVGSDGGPGNHPNRPGRTAERRAQKGAGRGGPRHLGLAVLFHKLPVGVDLRGLEVGILVHLLLVISVSFLAQLIHNELVGRIGSDRRGSAFRSGFGFVAFLLL
mmetsp:Transcript_15885/g.36771  ORF Transcript_15885/g.36771 Transcript_15885/m.36771 type:complete len:203 (+) Transcript_15885:413-1021(+)